MPAQTPTLYEWLGGIDALSRLTARFYERVKDNAVLAPIFAQMDGEHPKHVAAFLAEVLGGPADYSRLRGGHPHMIGAHLNRHLTQLQRREWIALLLDTADELKMPDDPEFRSALVGYLEWGSRLAVINSQAGASVDAHAPMPKWVGAWSVARIRVEPESWAGCPNPLGPVSRPIPDGKLRLSMFVCFDHAPAQHPGHKNGVNFPGRG